MNDPFNCQCATVALFHADGRKVIVNDSDEDRVLWAERGYFSADARAAMAAGAESSESTEPKPDPKDAETVASIPAVTEKKARARTAR